MRTEKPWGLEALLSRLGGEAVSSGFDRSFHIEVVDATSGSVVLKAPATPHHANASGAMHGGWIAGLLDAAAGAAVQSVLSRGEGYTTLALQVNYLRALQPGDQARIKGEIIRSGARVVTAEARLYVDDDLCASATATCLRLAARVE